MLEKSGVFLLDKPSGISSHDFISQVKNKFKCKKIGHAGTLDPLASGLMVVLINQATKISNYLLSADKEYIVEVQMFVQTDSMDITGKIVEEMDKIKISTKDLKSIIDKYNGYIYDQYPPKYSAIKINGKKLYNYARNQEEVEIKPRTVTIKECNLIELDNKSHTFKLKVKCSKGTYIRSLVDDITKELNIIGTVKTLIRTGSGNFNLDQATTIEKLSEKDLISMYDALMQNKHNLVEYHNFEDIKLGKTITLPGIHHEILFIINEQKEVIAIYKRVAQEIYKCQRGLWVEKDVHLLTEAEREK